jgi:pimeloyl-ACP methyl ester carboxylesterase
MRKLSVILSLLLCLASPSGLRDASAATPDRPVLFIPGILGTKLCKNNEVVWGGLLSLYNFERLRLAPNPAENTIIPCGLIDRISILGPFWEVHQYDNILATFKRLGYRDQETLFVFPYDWRLSNFDTAQALRDFIASTPQLRDKEFDIVAHSMGGIVTRIYLQRFKASTKVRKVVYLGTPFGGAMNALGTLSAGWGTFANRIAGGLPAIRRTTLSFPSFYELFPRYDNCCRLGSEGGYQSLDILKFDTWQARQWLPPEYASGPLADLIKTYFARAAELRDLMNGAVGGVDQVRVAGDAFATSLYLYVSPERQGWENWRFSKSRGDGTVPVWSASNNYTTLSGTHPSFSEHATIFDDEGVRNILLRELVSEVPPPVNTIDAILRVTTTAGVKNVSLIDLAIEPKTITPGGSVRLSLKIALGEPTARGEFIPTAQLEGPSGPIAIALAETTTAADLSSQSLTYAATIPAPLEQGAWQVNVLFPGQGRHAAYFETWSQP